MSRSRSNIGETICQPRASGEQQRGPGNERESEGRVDHIERDGRGDQDRRKVSDQAELLSDAEVARTRGDPEADPDRQAARTWVLLTEATEG